MIGFQSTLLFYKPHKENYKMKSTPYNLEAIEKLLGAEGTSYGELIIYTELAFLKAELVALGKKQKIPNQHMCC